MTHTILNVDALKRKAKEMKRDAGMTHTQALDSLAAQHGYTSWSHLMKEQNKFAKDANKVHTDVQPSREDAHLSAYDQPSYLKAIFR